MTSPRLTSPRRLTRALTRGRPARQIAGLKGATPAVHRRKEDREVLTLRKQLRDLAAIEGSKSLVSLEGASPSRVPLACSLRSALCSAVARAAARSVLGREEHVY